MFLTESRCTDTKDWEQQAQIRAFHTYSEFCTDELCVIVLLDQTQETTCGLEWQPPIAPLVMKRRYTSIVSTPVHRYYREE